MTTIDKKLLVVGISGVTCSGKSTLAEELLKMLPNSQIYSQDDYFIADDDPRHVWIPELNHINYDILSSLDMKKMTEDVKESIEKHQLKPLQKKLDTLISIPHQTTLKDPIGDLINIIKESQVHITIVEGFCIFNYKPLSDVCDLKYYLTLDKDECFERRQKRVYVPPDCPGYFEHCAWPEHMKQITEVRENVKHVMYLNGKERNHLKRVLGDIVKYL